MNKISTGLLLSVGASAGLLFALPVLGDDSRPKIDGITWGNWTSEMDPSKFVPRTQPIDSIVIHHTETPNDMSEIAALDSAQSHGRKKGWGGIAYHYLIGPSGTVYLGRDVGALGASGTRYVSVRDLLDELPRLRNELPEKDPLFHPTQNWRIDDDKNSKTHGKYIFSFVEGNIDVDKGKGELTLLDDINVPLAPGRIEGVVTVSFIGNFNPKEGLKAKPEPSTRLPYHDPTDAAKKSCVLLCAWLIRAYDGLTVSSIYGHRERADSTCPGQGVYFWLRGTKAPFGPTQEGPGILAIKELVPAEKHLRP